MSSLPFVVKNTFVTVKDEDGNDIEAPELGRSKTAPVKAFVTKRSDMNLVPLSPIPSEVSDSDTEDFKGMKTESGTPDAAPRLLARQESAFPTTCMLRNIPNKYTQDMLVAEIDAKGFRGRFDFFYAPMDFNNHCNMGYAFVNLSSHSDAEDFVQTFQGYRLSAFPSTKVCDVSWARVQGKDANVEHYRNSPVNDMGEEFRPRMFEMGAAVPFPRPNKQHAQVRFRRPQPASSVDASSGLKLFVGGLPLSVDEAVLEEYMSQFGHVKECAIIREKESGTSRGFGFCAFVVGDSVERALGARKHVIQGHAVSVKRYTSYR